ncbi:hypothetical protein LCGC14_0347460 [marine sediment metagenome]|uniref:Uncharacterized protein n=1 Tax=marine sediment metagenome TaxID=412755 RepID=A0A0F9THF3_9ZZZZ
MIYEEVVNSLVNISAILFWLITSWSLFRHYRERRQRRKEIVIEDRGYCPCRVSAAASCGEIKQNIEGETFECGVDAHLITCKSEGCNGLGDLIDQPGV